MLVDELKSIVGDDGWTTDPHRLEHHLRERRATVTGRTSIMVAPNSTAQVAAIMAACAKSGTAVVPQGGNTGLCGGAIPDSSGKQVLLSLARLDRIRSIDAGDFSMTVEAGCILANVQAAARQAGRLFPLSLGAEGSCQIGGNLATNAGGVNVIRYGSARELVLGLEVVLADGTVWDGLRSLRKDAAGYDLKQLFIGSEGTLGIITAATLRLFPEIGNTRTALVGLANSDAAVLLLAELRRACSDRLLAFEIISATAMAMALQSATALHSPFTETHPWYLLIEVAATIGGDEFEQALDAATRGDRIRDVVIAKNAVEADRFWRIRHAIPDAQRAAGVSLKHDISVPIGRIGDFMAEADARVLAMVPDARLVTFGHVGDGNLHYNISQPEGGDPDEFRASASDVSAVVYDLVRELGGSFSAEHGIGILKKGYLQQYRSATEIGLMRRLKLALDPNNLLNPGKVI